MKLLWLDDVRDPHTNDWLVFSPIAHTEVIWVTDYVSFVNWITENGLPDGICFDHDLSDFQAMKSGFPEMMEDVPWPSHERTGMDCAKWLVEYCLDNNLKLPAYNIQSANPAGKANIDGLLKSFNKQFP